MSEPAITAPLSRFLAVADIDRSLVFYRDVLGFEVRPVEGHYEAVSGAARIQLDTAHAAVDSTGAFGQTFE